MATGATQKGVPPRPRVAAGRCYWDGCTARACTDDHVPAKAFFFEGSELGADLKTNRLTVRSCREHNQSFSDDEEYVAFVAYMDLQNAAEAHRHAMGRQFEVLKAKVGHRLGQRIQAGLGQTHATALPTLRTDMKAVERVGEKIARGLHYRLTGRRLQGQVVVWSSSMVGGHPRVRSNLQVYATAFDELGYAREGCSGHPLVFEYAHKVDTLGRCVIMRFRFFRGFELRAIAFGPWLTGLEDKPMDWPLRLA